MSLFHWLKQTGRLRRDLALRTADGQIHEMSPRGADAQDHELGTRGADIQDHDIGPRGSDAPCPRIRPVFASGIDYVACPANLDNFFHGRGHP